MKRGKVIYQERISRSDLRENPENLYVFGDNMARAGYGGQAREMRGEPNAVGIVTKWAPGRAEKDYFTDSDFFRDKVPAEICKAFELLHEHLNSGKDIVIPSSGIGTGLAELELRAPKLYVYIQEKIADLEGVSK